MRIHNLGKVRNANRVLSDLSEYLQSFREGYDTVYYLNSTGREYVQYKKKLRKNQFVKHILMRNDFYIFSGMPEDWRNEIKIGDSKESRVCDALFSSEGYYQILEVDSQQKMSENKVKAQSYYSMYKRGSIGKHYGYFPVIIWLTTSELRREQLKKICNNLGLSSQVYTLDDIR